MPNPAQSHENQVSGPTEPADGPPRKGKQCSPGAWREGRNLVGTQRVAGFSRQPKEEKKQRNLIKHWLNSQAGAVPWPDRMI